jgi:hypothetical protein
MISDVVPLLECRLGEGGLLRRLEAACRLTRLRSQLVFAVLVTWLPMTLLSLLDQASTGVPEPLFYDAAMHVRLLVAVPVLLVLDQLFPKVCRDVMELLTSQGFIAPSQCARFERLLARAVRTTDSMLP